MGGPKGPLRGEKTHRADLEINQTQDPDNAPMQLAHRKPERSNRQKQQQMRRDAARKRRDPDRTDERDRG